MEPSHAGKSQKLCNRRTEPKRSSQIVVNKYAEVRYELFRLCLGFRITCHLGMNIRSFKLKMCKLDSFPLHVSDFAVFSISGENELSGDTNIIYVIIFFVSFLAF
jgi:hypothetical protein